MSTSNAFRYLGVELSGAKNTKTAVAAIEFYPREKKIFLLDIYDRVTPMEEESGDEALLNLLNEIRPQARAMGVNVPLSLPPCIGCLKKVCPLPSKCTVPAVKWMREQTKRAPRAPAKNKGPKVLDFTPYTQRPIELWARYQVLPGLGESKGMEIDETLGGNRGPLTARMSFLKRHLVDLELVEVWPKWTIAVLAPKLNLHKRHLGAYRKLEEGVQARLAILESWMELAGIFIYERDLKTLSQSLPAFDAFVCAYTALLNDLDLTLSPPRGFPETSGWIALPNAKKIQFTGDPRE